MNTLFHTLEHLNRLAFRITGLEPVTGEGLRSKMLSHRRPMSLAITAFLVVLVLVPSLSGVVFGVTCCAVLIGCLTLESRYQLNRCLLSDGPQNTALAGIVAFVGFSIFGSVVGDPRFFYPFVGINTGAVIFAIFVAKRFSDKRTDVGALSIAVCPLLPVASMWAGQCVSLPLAFMEMSLPLSTDLLAVWVVSITLLFAALLGLISSSSKPCLVRPAVSSARTHHEPKPRRHRCR
jgi:hypothetical protein